MSRRSATSLHPPHVTPPTGPAQHVPSFSRTDTPLGEAWCIGCEAFITLATLAAGAPCPGKETL